MEINSVQNAQVKEWIKLQQTKYRAQTGRFLVEGQHLIEEAMKVGRLETLLIRKGSVNPFGFHQSFELAHPVFDKLSQTVSSNQWIGICTIAPNPELKGKRFILCDRIQDPGNLGTIIRTALAFGFDQIILSDDCVDITNEKVIRSTQGAIFHLPIYQSDLFETVSKLKENGIPVYATGFENAVGLSDVQVGDKVAFILGNEGQGMRMELMETCDATIRVEMSVFDSLNVGIAAGIIAYHFRKRD